MWHAIFIGLLLGWAAAIPIGPINLEVIRRNLRFGSRFGVNFGLGACSADMTYFILLLTGALMILQHKLVLRIVGIIGALILLWFGIAALRLKPVSVVADDEVTKKDPKASHHYLQAYVMTLLNPMTIVFWASVSTQIAALAYHGAASAIYVGVGVLLGTVSWILALNTVLHVIRHRISAKVMHYFNIFGGVILIGFAIFGFIHALR